MGSRQVGEPSASCGLIAKCKSSMALVACCGIDTMLVNCERPDHVKDAGVKNCSNEVGNSPEDGQEYAPWMAEVV